MNHRMRRDLELEVTAFSEEALAKHARLQHRPVDEVVADALRYFVHSLAQERFARRVLRPAAADGKHRVRLLSFDLEPEQWARLDAEAESQEVSLPTLAHHAVIYYLADLDSGRVAEWVAGRAVAED